MLTIHQNSIFKNNKEISEEDFVLFLNEEVELNNVTFERFFKLILDNHGFFDIVFHSAMGGYRIKDFESDFLSEPKLNEFRDIDHLVLQWAGDFYKEDFSMYLDFSGKAYDANENMSYSMSMSELSEYKHLPLKLDYNIEIYNGINKILAGRKRMSLYDVIRGILYEISFYGPPIERQKVKEQLDIEVRQYDNDRTFFSLEELFQNIRQDDETIE